MARVAVVVLVALLLVCVSQVFAQQVGTVSSSDDWVQAVKNAAAGLNVNPASSWSSLMNNVATVGTQGHVQVGPTTYQAQVNTWGLPAEFQTRAIQTLGALIYAATEAEYTAQSIIFDEGAHTGSLTYLIVVARRDSQPADPNNPVFLAHILMTTTCGVSQQYSQVTTRSCHRCGKCLWTSHCCCNNVVNNVARGDTPQEIQTILDRMKQDQYNWLNAHVSYSSAPFPFPSHKVVSVLEAIASFISSPAVQKELNQDYSDPVIKAVQSNITIIRQQTDALRLEGIPDAQFISALTSISQAYNFYDDLKPFIPGAQNLSTFSYEFLQKLSPVSDFTYTWLVGGMTSSNGVVMHNIYLISSQANNIVNLLNNSLSNVFRTAVLRESGAFAGEAFPVFNSPWTQVQTGTVMDFLRQNGGAQLIQGSPKGSTQANPYLIPVNGPQDIAEMRAKRAGLGDATDPFDYIENAIKGFCSAWQDIANSFKTVTSTSITRIIRFGFTYFHELSTVNRATVPSAQLQQFFNMLSPALNLPSSDPKVQLMLFELDFSTNVTWDRDDFLFQDQNGHDQTVMVLKNGDPTTGDGNFFIITIDAEFDVAPDLLLVHKHRSILGGIFESDKDSIEDVPHVLTLQESIALQDFFTIVAMGKVAEIYGIPFEWPTIPPLNN